MFPYLDEELGTLDVGDERHGVVDGQPPGTVAVGHERGHSAGTGIAHGQVDHQLELLLGQEVGQVHQLAASALIIGDKVLERPLDGLHLRVRGQKSTGVTLLHHVTHASPRRTSPR